MDAWVVQALRHEVVCEGAGVYGREWCHMSVWVLPCQFVGLCCCLRRKYQVSTPFTSQSLLWFLRFCVFLLQLKKRKKMMMRCQHPSSEQLLFLNFLSGVLRCPHRDRRLSCCLQLQELFLCIFTQNVSVMLCSTCKDWNQKRLIWWKDKPCQFCQIFINTSEECVYVCVCVQGAVSSCTELSPNWMFCWPSGCCCAENVLGVCV